MSVLSLKMRQKWLFENSNRMLGIGVYNETIPAKTKIMVPLD